MEAPHIATGAARLAGVVSSPRLSVLRRTALVLAALAVATVAVAARADAYIYWANSDSGAISRANLDGTGANQSFTPRLGTAPNTPSGVAVDGAHIYWTYFNDGANIGRANLDGTGVDKSFIVAPTSALSQVAVDGGHVYWVSKYSASSAGPPDLNSPGTGSIGRANLDGTGIDPNFISGISFPAGGLAVDGSHLYWTSYVNAISTLYHGPLPGAIGRANLNGTGVQESFIATMPTDFGVAVDEAHVWWVDEGPTRHRAHPRRSVGHRGRHRPRQP